MVHRGDNPNTLKGLEMKPPFSEMCCATAPLVLEFDQKGNLLRRWSPGPNDPWMDQEHGIHIDHKNNVWLAGGGGADSQILKYTMDGKFLMQVGKKGARLRAAAARPINDPDSLDMESFGQPTKIVVDPKTNEAYVSDGYVNHRVVVLDADSGKFKRVWGAYGNKPDDTPVPGPLNPHRGNATAAQPADRGAAHDPNAPPQQQFRNPVHCVVVSKDDLVYVCDRQGDRLQVFTKDGKFVKEKLIEPKTMNAGSVWDVALSSDPQQTFPVRRRRRERAHSHPAAGYARHPDGVRRGRPPAGSVAWRAQHRDRFAGQHLYDRDLRRKAHPEVHLQRSGTGDEAVSGHAVASVREVDCNSIFMPLTIVRRIGALSLALCCVRAAGDRHRRRRYATGRSVTRLPHGLPNSPATCSPSLRTSTDISGSARKRVSSDSTAHASSRGRRAAAVHCRPARFPHSSVPLKVGYGSRSTAAEALARIDRGGITRYASADGAPSGVNALLEDRRGTLWAATSDGLFRYAGNGWSRVTDADGYDGEQAFSLYEDRAGRVWVGAARGLYRDDGKVLRLVDRTATSVESVIEDDAGNLWVTDRAAIIRKIGAIESPAPRPTHPPPAARLSHHSGPPRRVPGRLVQRRTVSSRKSDQRASTARARRLRASHAWLAASALSRSRRQHLGRDARRPAAPLREHAPIRGAARRSQQRWRANRGGCRRRQHLDRDHASPEPYRRQQPAIICRLSDARPPRRSLGNDVGGNRRTRRAPHDGPSRQGANTGRSGEPSEWAHDDGGCTLALHRVSRRVVLEWQLARLVSAARRVRRAVQQHSRGSARPRVGGLQQRRRRVARTRSCTCADRAGRPRAWPGVADRSGQRRRGVVRHIGRREPLPGRSLHVRHHGKCTHHGSRPDARRGCPGLRVGGSALGRCADALPCGRDGQDRAGARPPPRLQALRRERWTAARHADVAERRRCRARHGRADLGRQRSWHDDHRPAATARRAPCIATEPGSRHRQRRARQPGGRPAVRERQHGADRLRRPQPLGHVEAALPPPARWRRRRLGVRRETAAVPPTPTCGLATIDSVSAPPRTGSGPSRRCGRLPWMRRFI